MAGRPYILVSYFNPTFKKYPIQENLVSNAITLISIKY